MRTTFKSKKLQVTKYDDSDFGYWKYSGYFFLYLWKYEIRFGLKG